jgi:hypothetical protein
VAQDGGWGSISRGKEGVGGGSVDLVGGAGPPKALSQRSASGDHVGGSKEKG